MRVRDYDFIVTGILQEDESLMKLGRSFFSPDQYDVDDFNRWG
jgi:hypothetical protein